jgi:hypothetical protein
VLIFESEGSSHDSEWQWTNPLIHKSAFDQFDDVFNSEEGQSVEVAHFSRIGTISQVPIRRHISRAKPDLPRGNDNNSLKKAIQQLFKRIIRVKELRISRPIDLRTRERCSLRILYEFLREETFDGDANLTT